MPQTTGLCRNAPAAPHRLCWQQPLVGPARQRVVGPRDLCSEVLKASAEHDWPHLWRERCHGLTRGPGQCCGTAGEAGRTMEKVTGQEEYTGPSPAGYIESAAQDKFDTIKLSP